MPILDVDPGQSPEAPGTLSFYEQGRDPSTGFQVTSGGVVSAAGGTSGPVNFTGSGAGSDALTAKVTGDTQPRFVINADGDLEWGPGNGVVDITIARYAVGGLEISGALRFTGGQLLFGPAGDVNLYRGAGADELKTDDNLTVAGFLGAANGQTSGNWTVFGTALIIGSAGGGLQVKEGANATMGLATLSGGTLVVSTTKVTANSRIFLTCQVPGGTPGFLRVSARTAGTSFTILSSSGTDTSQVAWWIAEPAA